MPSRVLRSNPERTDRLLQFSSDTEEISISLQQHTSGEMEQEVTGQSMESNTLEPTVSASMDLQMVMQMLQKMQAESSAGFKEIKEFKEEVRHRVEHVDSKMEHLAARMVQCENHRTQDMKNIQDQINAIKWTNSTNLASTDQLLSSGKGYN